MSASGYTPIIIYNSGTATNTPTAGNLASGELAINTNDGKLYYKDSSGVVQVLATKATTGGTFTSITDTGLTSGRVTYATTGGLLTDSANMTFDGSTLTTLNSAYTGTLTGGTGIVNLGSGQFYKDASGNIGIGRTNPTYKIDMVVASGANALNITDATASDFVVIPGVSSGVVRVGPGAGAMALYTNGSERMRIDSSGNVGIGTSSPAYPLSVGSSSTRGVVSLLGTSAATPVILLNNTNATGGHNWAIYSGNSAAANFDISDVTAGASRLTIDSSGNVGIGTSSPSAKLQVVGVEAFRAVNDAAYMSFFNTANSTRSGYLQFQSSGACTLSVDVSQPLTFQTNGTERMRIDSSGNLLVGTTSTSVTSGGVVLQPNGGGTGISVMSMGHITGSASGQPYQYYLYNGTIIGSITQSGTTAVLYNVTSDARVKTNIVDAPSGNIDDIKVRSFDWKSDGSHQEYGMVAQELVEVAPYAVHQPQDAEEMMAVDYSKLVPMMIKEIQDLKAEVNQLKAKVGI